MGWKIIEIESEEHVNLYLNNLYIKRPRGKILINLNDIDTLIIKNTRTVITIRLINALARSNINVIFMDNMHEPNSYLLPINGHHNSLKILEKQLSWTKTYKGIIWKEIVANKIYNQKELIKSNKANKTLINYFEKIIKEVRPYDVTNREGHAAKVYWNNIFEMDFVRDQKSTRYTTINAMLNYGYSIIRSLVIRSIIKKGLDTRISLFHKSFNNFFALASDLMEPLRPLVDKIAYKNKNSSNFDYQIKDDLIGILEVRIKVQGKEHYLNNAVDICVDNLIAGKGWPWLELWD